MFARLAKYGFDWVIKTVLLFIFNYIGWIVLHPAVSNASSGDKLLTAGIIGLLFVVVNALVAWLLLMLGTVTCLMALFLLPLVGYFTLEIIAALTPNFLALRGFLVTALAGLILSLVSVVPNQLRRTSFESAPPEVTIDGHVVQPPVVRGEDD